LSLSSLLRMLFIPKGDGQLVVETDLEYVSPRWPRGVRFFDVILTTIAQRERTNWVPYLSFPIGRASGIESDWQMWGDCAGGHYLIAALSGTENERNGKRKQGFPSR
jgi:hypothetical protein